MRALIALATFTLVLPQPPAPNSSLRDLLRAAATYAEEYHQAFTTIVAEERYTQRLIGDDAPSTNAAAADPPRQRTLRSDVMLIRGAADETGWFFFRDVFEVDGRPVSSTRGRLEAWYQESRGSFMQKARALALEQARFNLGDILRTINVPLIALEFLLPRHQERFRFRLAPGEHLNGTSAIAVAFQERRRPTMIRTPDGDDVEARGTFWIEPSTGRVLRSQLRTGEGKTRQVRAVITVTYESNERLGMLVPVSMEEHYEFGAVRIAGAATYSNFRRFETDARIIR